MTVVDAGCFRPIIRFTFLATPSDSIRKSPGCLTYSTAPPMTRPSSLASASQRCSWDTCEKVENSCLGRGWRSKLEVFLMMWALKDTLRLVYSHQPLTQREAGPHRTLGSHNLRARVMRRECIFKKNSEGVVGKEMLC